MLRQSVKALLLALVVVLVVATPVLAYVYRAQYSVSNNSTSAYDMLGVSGIINNSWMAANGFMNASANDTRIETLAGVARPHMVVEDRTQTAVPSPAFSQTNLYYTTGNSELLTFDIIPGYDGYIARADDAAIEPSDNWSYQTVAWIDTDVGAARDLLRKDDAVRVFVSETVAENVTAAVSSSGNTTTAILRPDGNVICVLPDGSAACPNHWQEIDEAVVSDVDWVGQVNAAGNLTDIYSIADTAVYIGDLHAVSATVRGQDDGTNAEYRMGLRLGDDITWGTVWSDAVWATHTEWFARPGGGEWQFSDINDLEYCAQVYCPAGTDDGYISWGYITVYLTDYDTAISITNVAQGTNDLVVAKNPVFFKIGLDDSPLLPTTDNLTLNVPLYQSELSADTFASLDSTGFSINATLSTWGATGRTLVRAANEYVSCDNATALNGATSEGTFVTWVYKTANLVQGEVFSKTTGAGTDGFDFQYVGGNTARARAFTSAGNHMYKIWGAGVTALNTWQMITVVYDINAAGDARIMLYLNDTTPAQSAQNAGVYTGATVNPHDYRLGNDATSVNGMDGIIGWHWYYDRALTAAEIDEIFYATEGFFIDGNNVTTKSILGVSVFNNSENFTFMAGNSAIYADNITLAINGVRQLYYYPNDIIIGDNLPDRAGTSQNGTFIWGANPAGFTVTLGSMVSSGQPSLGADIDQPTQDILEDVEVSDWFVDPDIGVGGALLTNPIRPFVTLLSDNSTLTERQVWILYGLAFVLFVTVATSAVVRGHHGITGIMCAASMVGLVSLTIWPLWTVVFIAGAVVVGLVSERSPSL